MPKSLYAGKAQDKPVGTPKSVTIHLTPKSTSPVCCTVCLMWSVLLSVLLFHSPYAYCGLQILRIKCNASRLTSFLMSKYMRDTTVLVMRGGALWGSGFEMEPSRYYHEKHPKIRPLLSTNSNKHIARNTACLLLSEWRWLHWSMMTWDFITRDPFS